MVVTSNPANYVKLAVMDKKYHLKEGFFVHFFFDTHLAHVTIYFRQLIYLASKQSPEKSSKFQRLSKYAIVVEKLSQQSVTFARTQIHFDTLQTRCLNLVSDFGT